MGCQSNHSTSQGRSFTALLLIVLACALFLPFFVNADGGGAVVPDPIPPPPNGEGQTVPDTTYILPGGEDSTFYFVD